MSAAPLPAVRMQPEGDKAERRLTLRSLAMIVAITLSLPGFLCSQVIDFEALNAPGNGTGGLALRNQFAARGIIFNPVTVLDYSQGIVIPNFAHSGSKAVEMCYGVEFCT